MDSLGTGLSQARSRIISVSQIAGLDPIIVFLLADGTEISQPDANGERWVNRAYYMNKEMSEVDGTWIVHN